MDRDGRQASRGRPRPSGGSRVNKVWSRGLRSACGRSQRRKHGKGTSGLSPLALLWCCLCCLDFELARTLSMVAEGRGHQCRRPRFSTGQLDATDRMSSRRFSQVDRCCELASWTARSNRPSLAGTMSAFPETMRVRTMSRPETGRHSMLPSDAAVDAFRERLGNFAPQGTMMSPAALMSPSVNARAPGPARTNPANPLGGGGMPTVQQLARHRESGAVHRRIHRQQAGRDERRPAPHSKESEEAEEGGDVAGRGGALLVAVVVAMSTTCAP